MAFVVPIFLLWYMMLFYLYKTEQWPTAEKKELKDGTNAEEAKKKQGLAKCLETCTHKDLKNTVLGGLCAHGLLKTAQPGGNQQNAQPGDKQNAKQEGNAKKRGYKQDDDDEETSICNCIQEAELRLQNKLNAKPQTEEQLKAEQMKFHLQAEQRRKELQFDVVPKHHCTGSRKQE